MIIQGQDHSGKCRCGRIHDMTTKKCYIESGCLYRFAEYAQELGFSDGGVAIYDENTYQATKGRHPKVEKEILLSPVGLHANEQGVSAAMAELPSDCCFLVAIGSGTVHDITRYCAYEKKIPFISCPTAASVDGFCSSVAAMTWGGFKKTFTATAPALVIADLDVIRSAPFFLTRAGVGDMVGKYIALADWRIGHILCGEYLCEEIYRMTLQATDDVVASANGILVKQEDGFEKLVYGLLMSGLAMQLLGNSRCASGAEHHISHFIEMQPKGLAIASDALHGEKVGVGTLLARQAYEQLCASVPSVFHDYASAKPEHIHAVFGHVLGDTVCQENEKDAASGVSKEQIKACWGQIQKAIQAIPSYETLLSLYQLLGMKKSLQELGIAEEYRNVILKESPLVRNRLTLMRLRSCLTSL